MKNSSNSDDHVDALNYGLLNRLYGHTWLLYPEATSFEKVAWGQLVIREVPEGSFSYYQGTWRYFNGGFFPSEVKNAPLDAFNRAKFLAYIQGIT